MSTDRAATPEVFEALHRDGVLTEPAFRRALELSTASPGPQRWRRFLDWLLLGLGAACLLVGFILVVAFNWAALPAAVKLGFAGSLVLATALAAWRLGLDVASGRVALTASAVLVGPLLALYGQTYQTGADPWSLFAGWAGFIAVWVVIARFPVLWLVELLLVNAAMGLFFDQVLRESRWRSDAELFSQLAAHVMLNALAWLAWEVGAARRTEWMQGRWFPRVLAVATLMLAFGGAFELLISLRTSSENSPLTCLALLVALITATLWWFHVGRRDLFMVAVGLGAAMTAATTFIGGRLFNDDVDILAFFLTGLLIIGEVGAAAWWLRTKQREWGPG